MHDDEEDMIKTVSRKTYASKDNLSLEEWLTKAESTNSYISEIKELIEDFEDLGYIYYIGTSDLNIAYRFENLKKNLKVLMIWGDGNTLGFKPLIFYNFLEKYGYSRTIAENLLEGLRKYLTPNQKNKPYEREEGYYNLDIKTILENKNDILQLFENFKSNF